MYPFIIISRMYDSSRLVLSSSFDEDSSTEVAIEDTDDVTVFNNWLNDSTRNEEMWARIDKSHEEHIPGVELHRFDHLSDGDRVYVQRNDGKWHVGEVRDVGYAFAIVPFITFLRQGDQERLDNYSIEKVRRVKQHATVRSLNLTVPSTHELATDVVEEDDLAIGRCLLADLDPDQTGVSAHRCGYCFFIFPSR